MPSRKILGRAGVSLADVYDVEGSQAGLGQLDSEEVKTVHEMGGVITSERLQGRVIVMDATALAASTTWDIEVGLGGGVVRIAGVQVVSDNTTGRVNHMTVGINMQSAAATDSLLFSWDISTALDLQKPVRMDFQGTVATLSRYFEGAGAQGYPSMSFGATQVIPGVTIPVMTFRGLTTAFGAGTITPRALIYVVFASTIGISSRGLPVPSW